MSIKSRFSDVTFEKEQVGADVNEEQRTCVPVTQRKGQRGFGREKI